MTKLFSLEDINEEEIEVIEEEKEELEEKIENAEEEINTDFELANESLNVFLNNTKLALELRNTIRKKIDDDFKLSEHSLEGYYLAIKAINNNLGIKKIPAFEDFSNRRTFNSSLDIALEGVIIDFIKKLWEKIKNFLYMLYSKIKIFFKKIFNFNLDIDTYDKEIDRLVSRLNDPDYKLTDRSEINTKLPQILSDTNVSSFNTMDLLRTGINKSSNLQVKNLLNTVESVIGGYELVNNKIEQYFGHEFHKVLFSTLDNFNVICQDLTKRDISDAAINPDIIVAKAEDIGNRINIELMLLRNKLRNIINFIKKDILIEVFKQSVSKYDIEKEDLTDSAYEKLIDKIEDFNRVELVSVFGRKEMPFNLNFFIAFYVEDREIEITNIDKTTERYIVPSKIDINIAENKKLNENVKPYLPPLDKKELKDLYIFYKKFKENKIDTLINKFEKVIGRITKDMDSTRNSVMLANEVKLNNAKDAFVKIIALLEYIRKSPDVSDQELKYLSEQLIIKFKNYFSGLMTVTESRELTTSVMLLMLQRYSEIYRVMSIGLATSYTELRLELAKYIYNNLKRYSKF